MLEHAVLLLTSLVTLLINGVSTRLTATAPLSPHWTQMLTNVSVPCDIAGCTASSPHLLTLGQVKLQAVHLSFYKFLPTSTPTATPPTGSPRRAHQAYEEIRCSILQTSQPVHEHSTPPLDPQNGLGSNDRRYKAHNRAQTSRHHPSQSRGWGIGQRLNCDCGRSGRWYVTNFPHVDLICHLPSFLPRERRRRREEETAFDPQIWSLVSD